MVKKAASKDSRTRKFINNNRQFLKQYIHTKQESIGLGIVVVNLLLLPTAELDDLSLSYADLEQWQEQSIHQPLSYISNNHLWSKMISLKIKDKYKVDIQTQSSNEKTFIVFIKDTELKNFSIYTIKSSNKDNQETEASNR